MKEKKERKKERTKIQISRRRGAHAGENHYKEEIQARIEDPREDFARWEASKERSSINIRLQSSTEGGILLNVQLFLEAQMLGDMRMIISMRKGTASVCLIVTRI